MGEDLINTLRNLPKYSQHEIQVKRELNQDKKRDWKTRESIYEINRRLHSFFNDEMSRAKSFPGEAFLRDVSIERNKTRAVTEEHSATSDATAKTLNAGCPPNTGSPVSSLAPPGIAVEVVNATVATSAATTEHDSEHQGHAKAYESQRWQQACTHEAVCSLYSQKNNILVIRVNIMDRHRERV
ncbi:hypothetical protein CR513_52919, partial [Mucuna pruriens]